MLSRLMKMLLGEHWRCYVFDHTWVRMPGQSRRRACFECHRREVMWFCGYRFGRWTEEWIEHTYPLDADPSADPTRIVIDGYTYRLGDLHAFSQAMEAPPAPPPPPRKQS